MTLRSTGFTIWFIEELCNFVLFTNVYMGIALQWRNAGMYTGKSAD